MLPSGDCGSPAQLIIHSLQTHSFIISSCQTKPLLSILCRFVVKDNFLLHQSFWPLFLEFSHQWLPFKNVAVFVVEMKNTQLSGSELHDVNVSSSTSAFPRWSKNSNLACCFVSLCWRQWIISELACYTFSMAVVPLYDTLGEEAMVHILNLGERTCELKYIKTNR